MPNASWWRRPGFEAVLRAELRVNTRRGVTAGLAALCAGNAALWYLRGPAATYGWAPNSEFFVVRLCAGFTFFTLPLVAAVVMGDPVLRDTEARVDALVHATPVTRAEYLLGKYLGNVAVLVGCAACFAITLAVLQGVRPSGVETLMPARVLPFVVHYLAIVVVSALPLSALYFAVGTLARNARVVYGLAVSTYVLYVAWQAQVVARLPAPWRVAFDPLLMRWADTAARGTAPEVLNRLEFRYGPDIVANRTAMVAMAAVCLAVVLWRYAPMATGTPDAGRGGSLFRSRRPGGRLTARGAQPSGRVTERGARASDGRLTERGARPPVASPVASPVAATRGAREPAPAPMCREPDGALALRRWMAASRVEWQLLRAERGLVIMCPLAVVLVAVQMLGVGAAAGDGMSAEYAAALVPPLNLLLFVATVFLTGEAVHRDRTARIDPLVWSTPVSEWSVLLAKVAAVTLLAAVLVALGAATAAAVQATRGGVDLGAYAAVCLVVALPNAVFLVAASAACHVLARDKTRGFLLALGVSGALFSLYMQGYTHPLVNPLLYGRVGPAELRGLSQLPGWLAAHRAYVLALAASAAFVARLGLARQRLGATAKSY